MMKVGAICLQSKVHCIINTRQRKPKWQSRICNPDTQDTGPTMQTRKTRKKKKKGKKEEKRNKREKQNLHIQLTRSATRIQ